VFLFFGQQIFDLRMILYGPPDPLQTELSRFCKIKFLLEKETDNKNKENHLKELDEIFPMVWFAYVNFYKNTTKI